MLTFQVSSIIRSFMCGVSVSPWCLLSSLAGRVFAQADIVVKKAGAEKASLDLSGSGRCSGSERGRFHSGHWGRTWSVRDGLPWFHMAGGQSPCGAGLTQCGENGLSLLRGA